MNKTHLQRAIALAVETHNDTREKLIDCAREMFPGIGFVDAGTLADDALALRQLVAAYRRF